uniref:interleukin-8-like n=1 Tax=Myxine glutinosa TaxID=7769 RepID=UPI00358E35A5
MNHKYIIALAIALIVCCTFCEAINIGVSGRCECPVVWSNFIPPNRFHNLEIIAPNSGCRQTEIIVILKSDLTKTICLNPEMKWVKRVVRILLKSKST